MDALSDDGTSRDHRSWRLLLVAAGLSGALIGAPRAGAAADVTPFTVSVPTVTGPIPSIFASPAPFV
jgi:hypothetical protein